MYCAKSPFNHLYKNWVCSLIMNFQDLQKVEQANFYLDLAFRNARKHGEKIYLAHSGEQSSRVRKTEMEKIRKFNETIRDKMEAIIKNFPSIDGMPEFYQELLRTTLEYELVKKSLGAINWAKDAVTLMARKYEQKIKSTRETGIMKRHATEFYGRASSIMKQINRNLIYLEESRQMMKTYPTLKTELFTVAITGFPNIGKSTLLSKLTPAKPAIQDYAFTTTSINQGYAKWGIERIQFVDTPGVLNRQHMNTIEQQAYLVLKYLTQVIVYVIDLTEPYSLKEQEKLLKTLEDYDKPIIIYLSKTDILDLKTWQAAKRKYKAVTNVDDLRKKIEKYM